VTLLEVLAEVAAVANDAGDTVIVTVPPGSGHPIYQSLRDRPADHAPGAASKGSIHAGSTQEPASLRGCGTEYLREFSPLR